MNMRSQTKQCRRRKGDSPWDGVPYQMHATAIGRVAGCKNATTAALYVHNSEAAARRAVARRAEILQIVDRSALSGSRPWRHRISYPQIGLSAWTLWAKRTGAG